MGWRVVGGVMGKFWGDGGMSKIEKGLMDTDNSVVIVGESGGGRGYNGDIW